MKGAMESFRYIVHKGRNTSMTSIMHRRMKVMNPEVAKNAEDVEKRKYRCGRMTSDYCWSHDKNRISR